MKKIILLILTIISFGSVAQKLQDSVPNSKTKLEEFTAQTGVVIVRGFEEIGVLKGSYGTKITVESKEFTNVSSGEVQYGITIEVFKENGNYDKDHTSYIDYDEIEGIIKGLDYISKVTKESTKLKDFQADFSTKGDLKFSTFNSGDKVFIAISSGSIGAVTAYYKIDKIGLIKSLIKQGKDKIDTIK